MRPVSTHVAFLIGLAAIVLGAGSWTRPVHAAGMPTFAIVARDGRLLPATIEVPTGTRIKLTIRNEGPGPIEFENLSLRVEKVLAPGGSSFLVIHPLKPGSYRFIDEFHPDTGTMDLIAK